MAWRIFLAAVVLSLGSNQTLHAETLDPADTDALERFYQHFGGDDWRINDGWLDPDVDPCDWHGVHCGSWGGEFGIRYLLLPGNNLQGDLSESDIFDYVITTVDLRDNALTGALTYLPQPLGNVLLSDNQLSGPLPEAPTHYNDSLYELNLARNDFEGAVPQSWRRLDIPYLDLSGNRLTRGWENALLAAQNYINIADNEFSGSLDEPDVVISHLLDHNSSSTAGGINLCWNDFDVSSEYKFEQIAERHVGGANFQDCLGRERQALDSEISGSWFDPDRSGEGVSMQLLDRGGVLLYHFGFDGAGRQHWLIGVGRESDSSLHWPTRIESTRGRFGQGLNHEPPFGVGFGSDWRMDRVGSDLFHLERTYAGFSHCADWAHTPMPCPARMHSDRFDYLRLSRLAGTSCDSQHPLQELSGAWFDPERNGEGFMVEVLDNGGGLVYWFTYQPDGSMHQAWMIGSGEFEGQTLFIEEMIQPLGGAWGEDFDPDKIERIDWGSLSIEFFDEDTAHVFWQSKLEEYGSGDYPLQRLSRARLAECNDD